MYSVVSSPKPRPALSPPRQFWTEKFSSTLRVGAATACADRRRGRPLTALSGLREDLIVGAVERYDALPSTNGARAAVMTRLAGAGSSRRAEVAATYPLSQSSSRRRPCTRSLAMEEVMS